MKKRLVIISLLALAACGSDNTSGDKSTDSDKSSKHAAPKESDTVTKNLICPQVAILQAGEEVMDYGDEKPDPSQLVAKARMKNLEGDCGYRTGTKDGKDGIDINFTLHMRAEKGAHLGGAQTSFPYFIAIVDPSENIISRQVMTAQFHFSGLDKVAVDDEPLHVFVPLPEKAMLSGPDYRVLVGFQIPHWNPSLSK